MYICGFMVASYYFLNTNIVNKTLESSSSITEHTLLLRSFHAQPWHLFLYFIRNYNNRDRTILTDNINRIQNLFNKQKNNLVFRLGTSFLSILQRVGSQKYHCFLYSDSIN